MTYFLFVLEQDNRPLNKAMMVSKFESIVSTVLSDWNHFQSIENPNILVIHVSYSVTLCEALISVLSRLFYDFH